MVKKARRPVRQSQKKSKARVAIGEGKGAARNVGALGTLLAEKAHSIIGGPPTTGTARETGKKGGDKAPDDAAPDFDSD